jgi:uncharacterized membrane protein
MTTHTGDNDQHGGLSVASGSPRSARLAALLLGFSTAGLFDGILLHQILQWHHLLSAVQRPWLTDLRAQVMADGVFHAVMWCVLVAGLLLTLSARRSTARYDRRVLQSRALFGFGAWHVIDAVVDHWVLSIHHIRDSAANPLPWDIGWLLVCGVFPVIVGIMIVRRDGDGPPRRRDPVLMSPAVDVDKRRDSHVARVSPLLGWALVASACASVALAAPRSDKALLIALPGVPTVDVMNQVAALNARIIWVDQSNAIWSVQLPDKTALPRGYIGGRARISNGVVVLANDLVPGGCSF